MATTEQYKDGGAASYTFSIEYIKAEDIKVSVDGTDLTYTATNPPAQTTEYTVNGSDVIFKQASVSGSTTGGVRIYRETALEDADSATFVAGSSIRATDLNANHKLVRFASQEQNQKVVTDDIRDSAVTSAKILNNTIVDADIASNAEIEVYKLKDGTANQVLITQTDGTTVGWSSSLNLPTTLQVQGNTFLDSNTNVSGDFTVLNSGTQKFKVHNSTGNTEIAGTLTVSQNISNIVGATFNNVQVGVTTGNEIDTSSGSLTLDSASGNIILDDNVRVTGTFTVDGLTTYPANVVVTGSQLKIQADNSEFAVNNGSGTTKFRVDSDNGNTLIQGTATIADIDGAAVVTSGTSNSDTKFYSAKRSDELYYRKGTADDIEESGVPWSGNDSTIATTAAIDARIVDLVEEVGGFVPIADELSFPNDNPDINNGAGTLVSIQALDAAYTPNSSGQFTINQGTVGNSPVTITGAPASNTIAASYGMIVETTSTSGNGSATPPREYKFHRLVPKATEVTTVAANNSNISTVASNIPNITAVKNNETNITTCAQNNSNIQAVAGKETEIGRLGTADAVADMAILGTADVVADLNTLGTADVVADMNMLATSDVVADMNMLATSDVISDMNALATTDNITAMDTCRDNISSITNCSTNISSVNTFGDQYQVASNNPSTDGGGNALAAGDLYFNTSANELKVYNGSSWQGGVTAAGSFASTTGNTFTGDNRYNDGVKALFGTDSDFEIYHDSTGPYNRLESGGVTLLIRSNLIELGDNSGNKYIKCIDGGATQLYFDGGTNPKFQTASNGAIVTGSLGVDELYMGDNEHIKIGAEDDFLIYHGGAENVLDGVNHKIELRHGNEKHLVANPDGAVELYNDGVKVCITDPNGIKLLGPEGGDAEVNLFADEGDDNADKWRMQALASGGLNIQNFNSGVWENNLKAYGDGAVELYHNNNKRFETSSTGATLTGLLNVNQGATGSSEFSGTGAATVKITAGGAGYSQLLLTKGGSSTSNNYITSDATLDLFVGNSILQLASDRSVSLPSNNSTLKFGSDGNFRISRDATGSQIKNLDTGGQYLNIWTDDFWVGTKDGQESYIIANHDAGVKIYHVNSKKFETTAGGLNFFGNASNLSINLRTSDNTTRGSLYASNGDIVGFLSKDGTLALTCSDTSTRVYHNLLPDGSGTGAPKIGLTGARWHEVWANDAYLSTATVTDNINVTGYINTNRLTIDDDGSASPLCNIRADDGGPWGLCVGNDSADSDANSSGFRVYQNNNRDIYVNLFAGWNATGYNNSYIQHAYYNQSYNAISFLSNGKLQIQNNGDSIARFSTDVSGATYGSVFVNGHNGSATGYGGISINNKVNLAGNLSDGAFGIYNQAQSDWMAWFGANDSTYLYENGTWHLRTYASGAATNSTGNDVYHTLYSNNGSTRGHVYADNSNNIGFLVNDSNWGIRINSSRQAMFYGHVLPSANNTHDLGASSYRWRNIYTNDLNLSNQGSSNDVDGTWGDWTIQEGESDLFLKNNRSGKKYKFNLTEVS